MDMVFVMRIMQHTVKNDFIDLGDGANIACYQRVNLDVFPVSYTHLDVYKRQLVEHGGI